MTGSYYIQVDVIKKELMKVVRDSPEAPALCGP